MICGRVCDHDDAFHGDHVCGLLCGPLCGHACVRHGVCVRVYDRTCGRVCGPPCGHDHVCVSPYVRAYVLRGVCDRDRAWNRACVCDHPGACVRVLVYGCVCACGYVCGSAPRRALLPPCDHGVAIRNAHDHHGNEVRLAGFGHVELRGYQRNLHLVPG